MTCVNSKGIHLFPDGLVRGHPVALLSEKAIPLGHPFWFIQIHPHGDHWPPCWRITSPCHSWVDTSSLQTGEPKARPPPRSRDRSAAAPCRACPLLSAARGPAERRKSSGTEQRYKGNLVPWICPASSTLLILQVFLEKISQRRRGSWRLFKADLIGRLIR